MNKNQQTIETYARISESYARLNQENPTIASHRNLFASYLPNGVIYDIGCGTGRDVAAFQEMGYEVTGFDASVSMLQEAKKAYPTCSFVEWNMLEYTWIDAPSPNGIWACASLLHFEKNDFEDVFHQIVKWLKKDGVLYVSLKVKEHVETETIDGRFFQYYTRSYLDTFFSSVDGLTCLHKEENKRSSDCFVSYFLKKA